MLVGVNTHDFPIAFPSNGSLLVGRVHRRAASLTERQPAVLVTGSWLTVKEQMADLYASALAERGYTAVTFDFAGWGQSGGDPRQLEMPSLKVADIAAAAAFVSRLSFVQPGWVGHLGICASAQYALAAIAAGARISSFASVAGWFHDTASVAPFYGGAAGVEMRLQRAQEALAAYLRTGETRMVPAYGQGNDRAGMFIEMDYYANAARGAVSSWPNEMAELSWLHWLTFDGLSAADEVDVPSLFVHSDGAVFPEHVRSISDRVTGPAEVVWGAGSQIDFYDQPEQVGFALDAVDSHFRGTSGG